MAGVPQSSILGPLFFLIYINDLPNELKSNVKLFADDISLFTIVKDENESANTLNNVDLKVKMKVLILSIMLTSKWPYNWNMLFNPDPSKLAQEVLFSMKKRVQIHPTISLNNIQVERAPYQKHLGLILDEKLNFTQHIVNAISKVNKGISKKKKSDIAFHKNH